jgi:uncharacterized protein
MAEREGKSRRGFASMDPQRQREIASKGGKAAHAKGTAHEFDSDEARRAGRKGGEVVSRNRDHMAEIGRRGGEARGENRAATRGDDGAARDTAESAGGSAGARERVSRDSMGRSGIERESMRANDGALGGAGGGGRDTGGRETGERNTERLGGDRQPGADQARGT